MTLLALDFETYYTEHYSLSKMPTHQYLRDTLFYVLGCAVWQPGMPGVRWLEGFAECRQFFAQIDWQTTSAVAHNAQFDGAVLWEHFGHRPAWWEDTQLMARYAVSQGILGPDQSVALGDLAPVVGYEKGHTASAVAAGGEALAEYARADVRAMLALWKHLRPQVPQDELTYIDLHVRLATEPVLELDTPRLQGVAAQEPPELAKRLRKQDAFVTALRACGIEPQTKISPRTGKSTYAFAKTDDFMRSLAVHSDPRVRKLHELRTQGGSNINRTRAQRFIDVGAPLPVPLLYYGAHTGRSSGKDGINLQNLPRGGDLRRAIQAPEGYRLLIVDSGQVEVRVLAWLAGATRLLQTCRDADAGVGPDIYTRFGADVLFRQAPEGITKEQRQTSKPPVLACGFGQGVNGLIQYAASMGVTLDEATAQRAVHGYRQQYAQIPRYWDQLMDTVRRCGVLTLPSGRRLTYPGLYRQGGELRFKRHAIFSKARKGQRDDAKVWHGILAENCTQATARDVVFWQVARLRDQHGLRPVLMAHDEGVFLVPDSYAEQAKEAALEVFSTPPPWAPGLPLIGEAVIATDYSEKP